MYPAGEAFAEYIPLSPPSFALCGYGLARPLTPTTSRLSFTGSGLILIFPMLLPVLYLVLDDFQKELGLDMRFGLLN